MAVQFGELPRATRGMSADVWGEEAAALRARPGKWGIVHHASKPETASSFQQRICNGRARAFRPPGSFEATTRGCEVWARYIGEQS